MIRRIRRSLPWFGALATLLLLPLPVQADEIETEPYAEEEMAEPEPVVEAEVEEEPEPEVAGEYGHNNKTGWDTFEVVTRVGFDVTIVRPLYLGRFVVGLPFFIFYPFTLGSDYPEYVVEQLWTEPFEATFHRPLGEVPSDY